MNIEAMASAAQRSLQITINRSAGQHLRAMRGPDRELLDLLRCIGMESPTGYKLMPYLCAKLGIDYAQLQQHLIHEATV